jgi:hypothetical protein
MPTANTTQREARTLPIVETYYRHEIRVNLNSLNPFVVWDTLSDQIVAQFPNARDAVMLAEALMSDPESRCRGCGRDFDTKRALTAHQSQRFVTLECKPR